MSVKLLTEQNLDFLSLKGGCTSSAESSLDKMPHFWKSHVTAHILASPRTSTGWFESNPVGNNKN